MPRRGLDTEQVVEAAGTLADEGLARGTPAKLAQTLGVRPPSLYNHVASREALLRLIALRGVDELAAEMGAAAVGRAGEDALRAAARAYRDYVRAHPGCYEATLAAPSGDDPEL